MSNEFTDNVLLMQHLILVTNHLVNPENVLLIWNEAVVKFHYFPYSFNVWCYDIYLHLAFAIFL